jgi:hypothetical protein
MRQGRLRRDECDAMRPGAHTGSDDDAGGGVIQQDKRWMEASDVVAMFPSLVWKIQLEAGLRDSLNSKIEAALTETRRELPPLSAGQGWQSGHSLHRRDELRELVSVVA